MSKKAGRFIYMKKRLVVLLMAIMMALGMYVFAVADGTSDSAAGTSDTPASTVIGGHIKMTLFDAVDGVETKSPGGALGETEYSGFSFGEIILYISQKISEKFSVEVEPEFAASTGATPKLGTSIGAQMLPKTPTFNGFDRALAKYLAPMDVEISAGIVKPKFTMDYGDELFWDEEFNGSKFTADPWLGEMADSGIEIYKNFSAGDASIPVWLYALNGYGYGYPNSGASGVNDNNDSPAVMIHLEPNMGMFKLTGSYTAGFWDSGKHDTYQRASGGIQFVWDNLQLRSEYAAGRWENKIDTGIDARSYGWYIKAIYKFTPWLKLVYDYNVAELNFNGFFVTNNNGGENYLTHTLVLDYNITDSTYLMLQMDYADWKENSGAEGLKFFRPTLAVRTTF
jgi:hypothetical protein